MSGPMETAFTAQELADMRRQLTRIEAALLVSDTRPVLVVAEAAAFTKHRAVRSFQSWAKRYSVRPCGDGRYSRSVLERALLREAQGK
jgi:deoxyribodipyrimidine photolyase